MPAMSSRAALRCGACASAAPTRGVNKALRRNVRRAKGLETAWDAAALTRVARAVGKLIGDHFHGERVLYMRPPSTPCA